MRVKLDKIKKRNLQKGVTLIELLVVLVIIAILATTIIPNFLDAPDKARVVKAKQDVKAIENALLLYKLDNFKYPKDLKDLVTKSDDARNWKDGGYLKSIPEDPWGNKYIYINPGKNGTVDVYSPGADGVDGGTEVNADIGNWDL